jgi:hypothetical protein
VLVAGFRDGHLVSMTSVVDPSANGGSVMSSFVGPNTLTPGADYAPVVDAATAQLDGATVIPGA